MKKYLAEMVGTFVLTFLGCGAAVALGCGTDTASVIGTAIAFGLAVVAMAYTIGGISGCHINPAITLGCFLSGRIDAKDCGMYMLFQVIGAVIAAAVLAGIVATDPSLVITTATGANACSYGVTNGVIVEAVLTALFVLVVLGATAKDNEATGNFAGLAIGLSLILIHLVVLINGYDGNTQRVTENAEYIQTLLRKYCNSDGGTFFLYNKSEN